MIFTVACIKIYYLINRIYNADGSEAGVCGNALRCVVQYLVDNDGTRIKSFKIQSSVNRIYDCEVRISCCILG